MLEKGSFRPTSRPVSSVQSYLIADITSALQSKTKYSTLAILFSVFIFSNVPRTFPEQAKDTDTSKGDNMTFLAGPSEPIFPACWAKHIFWREEGLAVHSIKSRCFFLALHVITFKKQNQVSTSRQLISSCIYSESKY
ncbi:hypothetical protein KIL84_016242 [Mauremys mutica]|uniref:Uncharacterized protein n=1 Tax=Mauremys mutica TaxID=74926 RepID=A0A9D4ASR4_9SAUR|nr:hypothetical protein KIL84_016242 [Mauremys mutica]